MIYVGIDDTDMPDAPGTNQLARALALRLAGRYRCALIVRHQLLQDPRVPLTRKNSAASLLFEPHGDSAIESLINEVRGFVGTRSCPGSDPGACVTETIPEAIRAFGRACRCELVTQRQARRLAAGFGVYLESYGGTGDGVIGALAAVGLVADGDDGRVVRIGTWPDDLSGPQDVDTLRSRGVEVRSLKTNSPVRTGVVDVGKHLRPNHRQHRIVLFARPAAHGCGGSNQWHAVRLR